MVAYPRQPLAQYASELKDEIVVVTKGRRAVAVLVPLKNVDREPLALRPPQVSLPVDLAAVPDLDDEHHPFGVVGGVDDTVVALSHSIPIRVAR